MPVIPAPVDDQGNITVPDVGGVVIPIRESDAQGNPVDISAVPMRFYVKGRINKSVTPDPNFAQGKLVVLTDEDADQLRAEWTNFSLLDDSDPLVPVPVWSGQIRRTS